MWEDWEDYDFRIDAQERRRLLNKSGKEAGSMCDFDDFFDGFDVPDNFLIGGVLGFVEEQEEEERRLERELEGLDPDDDLDEDLDE